MPLSSLNTGMITDILCVSNGSFQCPDYGLSKVVIRPSDEYYPFCDIL